MLFRSMITNRHAPLKGAICRFVIMTMVGSLDPYPVVASWLTVAGFFTCASNVLKLLLTVHIADGDSYSVVNVYGTLEQVFGTNFDLPGLKPILGISSLPIFVEIGYRGWNNRRSSWRCECAYEFVAMGVHTR